MHRKFKGKRKRKLSKLYKFFLLLLALFFFIKLLKVKIHFELDNTLIKYIINDNNYTSNNNIYQTFIKKPLHETINNPSSLLAINFYSKKFEEETKQVDNNIVQENKPLVYLYNSHQTESYSMDYMEDYNINPTVLMAAYMLKERLDKDGIFTIVEEANISDYMQQHDMKYYQSYEASRHYLVEAMEKYDSIKLFIDIHRDAISHDYSTINIDGEECAKIMFVVGKEHPNYLNNLEKTESLNQMISDKYPTLSRGVLQKEGKDVNGIYNQDLGSNIMLIEIGGNYNNINEVLNTIDKIAPIIGEYINEKR